MAPHQWVALVLAVVLAVVMTRAIRRAVRAERRARQRREHDRAERHAQWVRLSRGGPAELPDPPAPRHRDPGRRPGHLRAVDDRKAS